MIGSSVGGGILLFGLAALAAWKAYAVWDDWREFKKFERNRPSFSETNNPLYKDPKTTVQNPMMNH